MDELEGLDAVGQAALVRSRAAKPSELVEAAIRRAESRNPRLNAIIQEDFEGALARARAQDDEFRDFDDWSPKFVGVPFLLKDLGAQQAGYPYHMGVRALRDADWREPEDSVLVQRLRAAGVVVLGRTNTPELGLMPITEPEAYGPTRNPWNLEHSPGGSSGGAGAAVAAGIVPCAHASDGGGSIRTPASQTGLVGLKPTRGRSSFGPAQGERWGGFSGELVVSRSVRDTAAFLDVICGAAPGDPYAAIPPNRPYASLVGLPVRPLRIGLMTGSPSDSIAVHPSCAEAAEIAARALADRGHEIVPAHPEALDDPDNTMSYVAVVACSVARALAVIEEKIGRPIGPIDVEPLTWKLAELGAAMTAPQYIATIDHVHRLGRRMAAWWESGFDLLITPTAAQLAPRIGELVPGPEDPLSDWVKSAPYGCFTSPFNQTGQPAISLPMLVAEGNLPVGAQLVAAYGREDLLIRVAAQLEQALPWQDRRAPAL